MTADGSYTLEIPELKVTYHSRRGALAESEHVFIKAGLHYVMAQHAGKPVRIFEMGFGTGLNAFLSTIEAERRGVQVQYTCLEPHPLPLAELLPLGYAEKPGHAENFIALHEAPWNVPVVLNDTFSIEKLSSTLEAFLQSALRTEDLRQYHVIYYDAFAPAAQPELWTESLFLQIKQLLVPGGVLVTYCSKGSVRRAIIAAGFTVEKLPGPPGKREMLRAMKKEA